jgi:drug/metabolite transporter (DMT)-like permease
MNPAPASGARANPRLGYGFAALNAVVSGFAIFINSYGVKTFHDSTLYTTLKNGVTGVILLALFFALASQRERLRTITPRQWGLLVLLAVLWGSLSYAIDFRGIQLSTPATSALANHMQFLLVAGLAAVFLGERFGGVVWTGLLILLVGLTLGLNLHAVHGGPGLLYSLSSTVVFAAGIILARYLLRELSALTVMTAKMAIGSAMLLGYVASTGSLRSVTHLNGTQWAFVLATGLILTAFTATAVLALKYASATVATATPTASPIITTALVAVSTQSFSLAPVALAGLIVIALAVGVIAFAGLRREEHGMPREAVLAS